MSPAAVRPAVRDKPDYRGGGGVVFLVVRVGVVREIGKRGLEKKDLDFYIMFFLILEPHLTVDG